MPTVSNANTKRNAKQCWEMLSKQCWAMLMLNTANADKIQCQYKPCWIKRQETLGAVDQGLLKIWTEHSYWFSLILKLLLHPVLTTSYLDNWSATYQAKFVFKKSGISSTIYTLIPSYIKTKKAFIWRLDSDILIS